jgi:hypothetical protein
VVVQNEALEKKEAVKRTGAAHKVRTNRKNSRHCWSFLGSVMTPGGRCERHLSGKRPILERGER